MAVFVWLPVCFGTDKLTNYVITLCYYSLAQITVTHCWKVYGSNLFVEVFLQRWSGKLPYIEIFTFCYAVKESRNTVCELDFWRDHRVITTIQMLQKFLLNQKWEWQTNFSLPTAHSLNLPILWLRQTPLVYGFLIWRKKKTHNILIHSTIPHVTVQCKNNTHSLSNQYYENQEMETSAGPQFLSEINLHMWPVGMKVPFNAKGM
mgnify:CR=1 FL=1